MIERFRLNCAYILVLSILLQSFVSYCHPDIIKDTSSNAEDSGYVIEDQRDKVDPSIEQIFRGPGERKNDPTNLKRNIDTETSKMSIQAEDVSKRARVKRDSEIKRSGSKALNEAGKSNAKRSLYNKDSKASSRTSRSSRDLPKLPNKDYEIPLDQDKSEYADEADDDSAIGPPNKEMKYKDNEFRVGEDSERFIDQEERSSLYDDFEAKDVVKRGISGVEDYEEMDEEAVEAAEDGASLDENAFDEESDKRKVYGDVRVKREHENSKETNIGEVPGKAENPGASSDLSNDLKAAETSLKRDAASDKDNKLTDGQISKIVKDANYQGDQSKRNAPEKSSNDGIKVNSERETVDSKQSLVSNEQMEIENNDNAKFQNQENQETAGDKKTQEIGLSSDNKALNDLVGDSSSLKGASKTDESKIIEIPSREAVKIDVPANAVETAVAGDAGKLDNSKNEAATRDQLDADYEKRVEEQIQRKIDSIKEEIKREIAENQRMKEIEDNNAKFDELLDQEDDDEEQALEPEPSDKRDDLSKRSVRNSDKSQARDRTEKRLIRRKKRQGENGQEKTQAGELNANKKSRQATTKKRSVAKSESQAPTLKEIPKKREYTREVFLVRNDRKKKRKRRSKNSMLNPKQRTVKLENNLPADFALDTNLRGDLDSGKSSVSKMREDEKGIAEQDFLSKKKSDSVASLTGSNEELGPLATEYREAFGGLNAEPGVALARFKRIKRVLRAPASNT